MPPLPTVNDPPPSPPAASGLWDRVPFSNARRIRGSRGGDVPIERCRGDAEAVRDFTVNGKRYFTGALLLFPHHVADDVLSGVDRMAKRLKAELRRNTKKQGEPAEISDHGVRQLLLSGSVACRLLTQTWLVDALDKAQAPLPEIRNTDGEEITFSQGTS
jgi:hypothetical protein